MTKKVLVLKGSPRKKGNSAILAEQAIRGAKENEAEIEEIYLHGLKIQPCAACDGCRKGKRECVTRDDMQKLYPLLKWADSIIIASPIYFFTFSAQVKLCIDRWYAFAQPDGNPLTGKQFGILLTYGDTDVYTSGAINAIHTFESIFGYMHNRIDALVYGSASDEGDIKAEKAVMEQAFELGRKLSV